MNIKNSVNHKGSHLNDILLITETAILCDNILENPSN